MTIRSRAELITKLPSFQQGFFSRGEFRDLIDTLVERTPAGDYVLDDGDVNISRDVFIDSDVYIDGVGTDVWIGSYAGVTGNTFIGSGLDGIVEFGWGRPQNWTRLSPRLELKWVAGRRGKPGIAGDITDAAEAVRMLADPDFCVVGTNAASALSAYHPGGGIQFTTGGVVGDQMILAGHTTANISPWGSYSWLSDDNVEWECEINTFSDTDVVYWAGLKLTDTSDEAVDANQLFFKYQDGVVGDDWKIHIGRGGVQTTIDSGVLVTADTTYHLRIFIEGLEALFFINGVLIWAQPAIPGGVDYNPYIGVQCRAIGTLRYLIIRGCSIHKDFTGF